MSSPPYHIVRVGSPGFYRLGRTKGVTKHIALTCQSCGQQSCCWCGTFSSGWRYRVELPTNVVNAFCAAKGVPSPPAGSFDLPYYAGDGGYGDSIPYPGGATCVNWTTPAGWDQNGGYGVSFCFDAAGTPHGTRVSLAVVYPGLGSNWGYGIARLSSVTGSPASFSCLNTNLFLMSYGGQNGYATVTRYHI